MGEFFFLEDAIHLVLKFSVKISSIHHKIILLDGLFKKINILENNIDYHLDLLICYS